MRRELLPILRLAGPVILAEIGWMAMGVVDVVMVGPLGPAAIGAVGMSSTIYFAIAVFGMGVMLGLDTLVSQAYGAGRRDECIRWLHQGTLLALIVAPLVMALSYAGFSTIERWGLHPDVRAVAEPYLMVIALSTLPLLLYSAFRRYLQGIHAVAPVMWALITANLVNVAANWVLVYGNLGAPALGATGSAWATGIARTYMAVFLCVAIAILHRREGLALHVPVRFDIGRVKRLVALGAPAASQVTLEVGVFAMAATLAAKLDPVSAGAHQMAANLAGLAFMIPLGMSSAGAVRVGHAIGGGDRRRAAHAGWATLGIGLVITTAIAGALLAFPVPMLRIFTTDTAMIAAGVPLLAIAAGFQLFDGTQGILTGVLRGLGDTHTPMLANVVGHWVIGLPVGYALCFWMAWGVMGLWIGLSVGLLLVAVWLLAAWIRRAEQMVRHI